MSKLAKGLAVSTLAVSIAVLYGAGTVSANAYFGDYKIKKPHQGSYASQDVHFNEKYDNAVSYFYYLKQDEKKHNSEHFSHNSNDYNHSDKNKGHGKHSDDKKKSYDGWGGYGNSVSINYDRYDSSSKKFEEIKAHKAKESYASGYHQSSDRGNYGGGYGKKGAHGNHSSHNVTASVNFNKEESSFAAVKAEAAHSSSVNSSVNLSNYGPHGGHQNSVSEYQKHDNYSKIEASIAEHQKHQSSVNYSADTSKANYGDKGGYGNVGSSSTNYSADSSYEASKEVKYAAEESSSYSSGFNSNSSSNQGGYSDKSYVPKKVYAPVH